MAAVTDSAAESAASVCVEAKYDADGYPLTARRRLKRLSDKVVVDIDDGQQFRPRKIKGGFTRLVPIFKRRVDWKSSEGYAAMRLLLSCMGAEGEYELWDAPAGRVMDVQTWTRQRYKTKNCPPVRHRVCGETVTSTNITSLQQGQGLGCACRNKTEAKLQGWLTRSFPNAVVVPQSPGPKTDINGQTRFDFLLRFSDEHAVFIELDGAQHFWKDAFRYNERRCGLDKLKEEWAVTERGRCVVRVLQDDVWWDKYDWQGWIVRSVASSRHGAPRVFTPSVPEYTSDASVYAHVLP